MSISQVIYLELENSGNSNLIAPSLIALYTPTAEEFLDLEFFIDLYKFKWLFLIIEILHPVSNKIYK